MSDTPPTVPEGYHTVTPWIIGDAAAIVAFIERVFGGREKEGSRVLVEDGSIGHVEVDVGDSVVMLFDRREGWPPTPSFLRVYVDDAEAVVARARDAGATVVTEPTPLFWGDTVGRVRDPWGNVWWVQQRVEELSWAEMEERMRDPAATSAMRYVQDSLDGALRDPTP